MKPLNTRFAPSPTGTLHLGHTYAAQVAHHFARQTGGRFILRIDDIDYTRCQDQFTNSICNDLLWLGMNWDGPTSFQSKRLDAYQAALQELQTLDLVYPCYLSRKELAKILSAPHGTPIPSDICNTDELLSKKEQKHRAANGMAPAWRLRMSRAKHHAVANRLSWQDCMSGSHQITPEIFGDVVIARGDIGVAYHLAVVVDDALDQISLVTRGLDLAPSTHLHRLLQKILNLPEPIYLHHELVCDTNGMRLAKRDDAVSIEHLRRSGLSPSELFDQLPALPTPSFL